MQECRKNVGICNNNFNNFTILLGTLGASLLGNLLAGKGIVRAGSGNKKGIVTAGSGNKKEKGIVRAGSGKQWDF